MNTHDPRPMAVDPALLAGYRDLLRYHAGTLPEAVINAAIAAATPRQQSGQAGAIAVVPLHGLILRRPTFIDELFGAASLDGFMATMRIVMGNPDVTGVVIDVDSPGGEVDGVTEAAAELRAMKAQKPIVAIADTMCASAAYWLASQATEIVVSPSGGVGAIGVYAVYDDISGLLEQEGVKRTILSAGKFKAASVGGLPLSDAARGQLQAIIDSHYNAFVNDVAKGRGVPVSKVRGGYGEGLYLPAAAAKAEGLVDRIAPIADVVRSPALRAGVRAGTEIEIGATLESVVDGMASTSEGTGEPMVGIEAPTDGTMVTITSDDPPADQEPAADLELYRRKAAAHAR